MSELFRIKRGTVNLYFTRLPDISSTVPEIGDSKTDMSNIITSFLFLFLFLFLHIGKVIANSINTFDRIGKLFIYEFHYFIVTDILGEEILNSLCLFFFSFRSQDWNANFSQLLIILNRGKFSLGN